MKKIIMAAAMSALLSSLFAVGDAPARRDFTVSTTIDFLDYCFADPEAKKAGYLPLDVYEERLREVAETGVKKLYLRVNVRGLTLYPTTVTKMYGEEGRFHWQSPEEAQRLIATLAKYDPCAETIRIGRKYGMEVWAWESLWEDGGVRWFVPDDRKYADIAARLRFDAMNTPLFLEHPEYFSWLDPKRLPSSLSGDELAEFNRKAQALPITRIVMTDHVKGRKPVRIKAEDIRVLVSDDNMKFTPYPGKFTFAVSVTPDGFNRIELGGLNIRAGFVKLAFARSFDAKAANVTMASDKNKRRGQHLVYNSSGEALPTVWTVDTLAGGVNPEGPLSFAATTAEGWDFGRRSIGFAVGEVEPERYFYGVAELAAPPVREFKLARFVELARYPFDGFIFNMRSHAAVPDPENYGYNPEIRSEYLKRYGVDIWKDEAEPGKLNALRMEGVAEFFRLCRANSGGRPLYISGWAPPEWKPAPGVKPVSTPMYRMFLHLPLPYKQFFRDGSVDGVLMVGYDFADYFTAEVTGGRPLKLGVFRELAHLTQAKPTGAYAGFELRRDLENIAADPRISEVELYETLVLSEKPHIRKLVSDITGENVSPCSQP